MNLIYITPKKDELWYRQKLIQDPKTMEYNKDFGGIVPFPKEKWDIWYDKWINSAEDLFYYSYVFDEEINEYIGEIAYRKNDETNTAMLSIIIDYNKRGKGYGVESLKHLVRTAFINGFNEVRDDVGINNISSQKIFEKFGFINISKSDNYLDYRLTKADFIKKYGPIE